MTLTSGFRAASPLLNCNKNCCGFVFLPRIFQEPSIVPKTGSGSTDMWSKISTMPVRLAKPLRGCDVQLVETPRLVSRTSSAGRSHQWQNAAYFSAAPAFSSEAGIPASEEPLLCRSGSVLIEPGYREGGASLPGTKKPAVRAGCFFVNGSLSERNRECAMGVSNPRPLPCQGNALPLS